MPELKKVLCTAYSSDAAKDELRKALEPAEVIFDTFIDREAIARDIQGCDAAILNGDLDDSILADPELRWVHCCRAGVEKSARPEVFERGIILTSSAGRSAPSLAEHAMMFIHALTYDLPMLMRAQQAHKWAVSREYFEKTGLYRKTAGILGLGNTGKEVARLCKAYDMHTIGYCRTRREVQNVDEVYASYEHDDLNELLSRCDYVILCIELNDHTYHMIGRQQLNAMKKSAFLVNMGRGKLIDEPEMIQALKDGTICGAGLDTFETEPLPPESPLWDLPNVIITPHITPQHPDREKRMLAYVFENIEAYRRGSGFVNLVTRQNTFSH